MSARHDSRAAVGASARRYRGALASTAAALVLAVVATPAQAAFSDYGFASASAAESSSQAGAHPDVSLTFELKTDPASETDPTGLKEPYARTKDLSVELPPGLIGNPNSVPQCTTQQFVTFTLGGEGCPQDSQIGVTFLHIYQFNGPLTEPIFNMEAPSNDTVARLGFYAGTIPYFITAHVRSGSDYGLTATLQGLPAGELVVGATTQIWGVPAAHSHDKLRLTPHEAFPEFKSESPPRPSGLTPAPFMTNPTSCGVPLGIVFKADSFQIPGQLASIGAGFPETTGCGKLGFEPSLSVTPTSREAAGPTGLDANLTIPQNEAVNGLATSQLRGANVTLPRGMTIASGAADGLQACSDREVRLGEDIAAACPEASKIGTAEFDVPPLSRRLHGALYQRTPVPGRLFRIWLVSDELGVHVKIAGDIHVDPATGQIESVFVDTPQVPARELKLHFKSGSHGVLANPPACGAYRTHFEFAPWSGNPLVSGDTPMTIDEHCASGGFSPRLNAGTTSPSAGSFSPFALNLTRADGEQNVSGIDVSPPPGLLAKLAGVPVCPAARAETGACDSASQIGTTTVAAGPGPSPLWIPQPGKAPTAVYLAGPYKGAPYSLAVKVPAQAGPFDLGTVVTRAGIYVDPVTARVTVKSDPLPQILEGVPIYYRTIHVDVDRRSFTLNPTSCDPMSVDSRVTSQAGATADPSARFQAGNCASLPFKPKLSLSLAGGTRRSAHPRLRAVLKAGKGEANIGRVSVALPHSEFLAQEHIRTICTRVQFTAGACPAGSVYGHATASTPLLDQSLSGPVYLRSSSNPLPDLVVALHGPIDIDLAGRIDSINGGIRSTFAAVPDAPVTKFVLEMKGGKKGLLVNSRNLCRSANRAVVKMDGQNGKAHDFRPALRSGCGKKNN
jgi:hypothetical protein